MALFVWLASVAAMTAFVAADSAAKECYEGACEADETGLMQRGTKPAARVPAQSLAGEGAETEAEPARSDQKWWWDDEDVAVGTFDLHDIDKALDVGTPANIGPNFDTDVLDLTGIWYILWDASSSLAVKLYREQRMEIAVSFAGSTISGYSGPGSSFQLKMPGQMPRHWAYSNGYQSTLQMFAHAISWSYCDNLTFNFESNRKAAIDGIGDFIYVNEDQWQRPTETPAGTFTYKLSRIVYANGTRSKYFGDYKKLMKGWEIEVWKSTDMRERCKSTAPISALCYLLAHTESC